MALKNDLYLQLDGLTVKLNACLFAEIQKLYSKSLLMQYLMWAIVALAEYTGKSIDRIDTETQETCILAIAKIMLAYDYLKSLTVGTTARNCTIDDLINPKSTLTPRTTRAKDAEFMYRHITPLQNSLKDLIKYFNKKDV